MEEKRYPIIEEEESTGKVSEPIGAVAYTDHDTMQSIDPEDNLPISGPSSWEEALADLDSSESDILNGRGTSWTIVKQMMSDRIMEYAG